MGTVRLTEPGEHFPHGDELLLDAKVSVRAKPVETMSFAGPAATMREAQRRYASWVLEQNGGHRGRTAETLGIDPKTLAKLLSETD